MHGHEKSSWQNDHSIFQRILEVFTFELYTLPVLSSTRKPRQVLIFNFKIKKDQKRRCYFIIWSNDNQTLHKSHTCYTDVAFLPAIIKVPPPGHSQPDTGPSFRWWRRVCSPSTCYPGSSVSCVVSDGPGSPSLRHEKKLRPLSADCLEDRPTLAPPSFLQPVVVESNKCSLFE